MTIVLHTHNTPNGHKISIALEELCLPYELRTVDVRAGEQFDRVFTELNPNSKIPVLEDLEHGVVLAESNAILLYLAEREERLMPKDPVARLKALELLFFQASNLGPMWGQRAHFAFGSAESSSYALARYETEGERLNGVLEAYLDRSGSDWLLGVDYSICDIAVFGWLNCAVAMGFCLEHHPKLSAWYERMAVRPAVAKGITVPNPLPNFPVPRRANRYKNEI